MPSDFRQIKDKAAAKLFTRFPVLVDQWAKKAEILTFSDTPWSPLTQPINRCRLALITTGGVHLKSQRPFDMFDPTGDPEFREIPDNTSLSDLIITHNYYDHKDADQDVNIVLPLQRAAELRQDGTIKAVNHRHFSFMGHISGRHLDTLTEKTAPAAATALSEDKVDIAILAPA